MRIAFDLDDTLIPNRPGIPREQGLRFILPTLFFKEQLRHGTRSLLLQLSREGHDIWLYTTSLRSPILLKIWLCSLGIRLGGIINQTRHNQVVSKRAGPERNASKYPPAFAIDLLIDDSLGVKAEGRRYGFAVIQIDHNDLHWVKKIRQHLISEVESFI